MNNTFVNFLNIYAALFEQKINKYWETVLDTIQNGIMIVDTDGAILSANKAFETLTGYIRSELLGKPCSILNRDKRSLNILNL